jgi:hypothetical protein
MQEEAMIDVLTLSFQLKIGMSPSEFVEMFRKEFGVSSRKYLKTE